MDSTNPYTWQRHQWYVFGAFFQMYCQMISLYDHHSGSVALWVILYFISEMEIPHLKYEIHNYQA